MKIVEERARVENFFDTTENWEKANPVLLQGEIGIEKRTGGKLAIKVGDGMTAWKNLAYIFSQSSSAGEAELQERVEDLETDNTQTKKDITSLKASTETLQEGYHTHDNKETLDGITSDKIATWDGYSAEIQTVKDGLVGKKDTNSPNSTGEVFNDYANNKATGGASHAEGGSTTASGANSHAEGSITTASGNQSHAEGSNTIAFGNRSHAEGFGTNASGANSHAEGNGTTASGVSSHAEGDGTKATEPYSHAEGNETTASGVGSHAEGLYTVASGAYSHSEGGRTTASGNYSHAEGESTIASGIYQHTQGKFNVEDSDSSYAFIIGNGTDKNNRSNAFAIDWDGKIYVNNATDGVDVSALATQIGDIQTVLASIVEVTE